MPKERIISADSHVLIRDEDVRAHLPRRLHDDYTNAKAAFYAKMLAGKPQKQPRAAAEGGPGYGGLPTDQAHEAAGRKGEWDPHERLRDMDVDGVDAEVLYTEPSAGTMYYDLPGDGRRLAFEAFNTAALAFAAVDPRRLLPVYLIPVVDVDEAVAEVHRVAKGGARAVMLPLYPQDLGLPGWYDKRYDRLWSAIQETGMPISQHVGASSALWDVMKYDPTPAKGIFQSLPPLHMAETIANWIVGGTLERFPGLRIVLVEAGLGWIPFFIARLDNMKKRHGWDRHGMLRETPSFYWKRQCAVTFEEDEFGVRNRHAIGVETLMWATDYPHPDSTGPHSQDVLKTHLEGVPLDEARAIIGGNAARLYRL